MFTLMDSKRFQLQLLDAQDPLEVLRLDVETGFLKPPRSLSPKYFYDEKGSALFDEICKTKEYYPTRVEAALLQQHAQQIIQHVKPTVCVELGAGTSAKTEVLLSRLCLHLTDTEFTYFNLDVCHEILVDSARRLLNRYENLHVHSIVGEYFPAIEAIPSLVGSTLYAFIGSSIGNFLEKDSVELLSKIANRMSKQDYFLVGIDRVKDKQVLESAYNDSEGITAQFNLNVLDVLNYKLDANFDLQKFSHHAIYNEQESQIEMYLISLCDQEIQIPKLNKTIRLEKNEKILTEISRKYTKDSIQSLFENSGLVEVEHFEPENGYFSLVLAKRKH